MRPNSSNRWLYLRAVYYVSYTSVKTGKNLIRSSHPIFGGNHIIISISQIRKLSETLRRYVTGTLVT